MLQVTQTIFHYIFYVKEHTVYCAATIGFGRRCAYLSFWGAVRSPPAHRSFAASYSSPQKYKKMNYFQKQNASLLAQTQTRRGVYLSTGLSWTLLSYIASYWATLHPPELRCTLMSYTAPYWDTLYPLSYAAFKGEFLQGNPSLFANFIANQ
jgi:hypothetical protein